MCVKFAIYVVSFLRIETCYNSHTLRWTWHGTVPTNAFIYNINWPLHNIIIQCCANRRRFKLSEKRPCNDDILENNKMAVSVIHLGTVTCWQDCNHNTVLLYIPDSSSQSRSEYGLVHHSPETKADWFITVQEWIWTGWSQSRSECGLVDHSPEANADCLITCQCEVCSWERSLTLKQKMWYTG